METAYFYNIKNVLIEILTSKTANKSSPTAFDAKEITSIDGCWPWVNECWKEKQRDIEVITLTILNLLSSFFWLLRISQLKQLKTRRKLSGCKTVQFHFCQKKDAKRLY